VHVEQPLGAGALMQVVDILRDDQQLARPLRVQPCERMVCRVRFHFGQLGATLIVEVVHQHRIAGKRLRRADILDAVTFPEAVRSAKGGQPALGRDAGAGQHDDVLDVSHAGSLTAPVPSREPRLSAPTK
jgi:hypothetical protein